jgi:serine/threonine protein kinase
MANFDIDTTNYEDSYYEDQVDIPQAPKVGTQGRVVDNHASFLALVLHCSIPVLSSVRELKVMENPSGLGRGASFNVSGFKDDFNADYEFDFVNNGGWKRSIISRASELVGDGADRFKFQQLMIPFLQANKTMRIAAKRVIAPPHATTDAVVLAAITREIRVLGNPELRLSPFVVSLLGVSWHPCPVEGRYWPQLLLERSDYGTLNEYLAAERPSMPVKLELIRRLALGIQALHAQNIVHGDIKPQNILIFKDEEPIVALLGGVKPKLADFGFSTILDDYEQEDIISIKGGTPGWTAPEISSGFTIQAKDLPQSDIFAFGLVACFILGLNVQAAANIGSPTAGTTRSSDDLLDGDLNSTDSMTPSSLRTTLKRMKRVLRLSKSRAYDKSLPKSTGPLSSSPETATVRDRFNSLLDEAKLLSALPEPVADFIWPCLQHNPANRPTSSGLVNDITVILPGEQHQAQVKKWKRQCIPYIPDVWFKHLFS